MNLEAFSDILEQLRQRIDDAEANLDEELSDRLRGVRSGLRAWDKDGAVGSMPHQAELLAWGIALNNEPPSDGRRADSPPVALSPARDVEAADGADEDEDDLREAVLPLAEHDAEPHAFADPAAELPPAPADEVRDESEDDRNPRRPVADLQAETAEAGDEVVEPSSPRPSGEALQQQIDDFRQELAAAGERRDYPALVELLSLIEALAADDRYPEFQPELNQLVADARRSRDDIRNALGMASTKAASEDYAGAYEIARDYLDRGVPVAFDERGVFGSVGAAYAPTEFLRLARQKLLDWSREKALERQQAADQVALSAPRHALQTLREARRF